MSKFKYFVGIDVLKEYFDVVVILEGVKEKFIYNQFINDYKGIKLFCKWFKEYGLISENMFVCLEYIGMYGKLIIKYLIGFNFLFWVEMFLKIICSIGV